MRHSVSGLPTPVVFSVGDAAIVSPEPLQHAICSVGGVSLTSCSSKRHWKQFIVLSF